VNKDLVFDPHHLVVGDILDSHCQEWVQQVPLFAIHVELTARVEAGTPWALCHTPTLALTPGIASSMTATVLGAGAA